MITELHSLSKEEIVQRQLAYKDLWIIKLGEEIKGPFAYQNLKAYVAKNESFFEEALASRLEPQDWKPLFSFPQFQRRTPQILKEVSPGQGPFWLLENGLKSGPFEKSHILNRLENNSLIATDNISNDQGKSWIKIYDIPEFDRRSLLGPQLPAAPLEQTLAQIYGKKEIEEDRLDELDPEILATTAHRGLYKSQVLQFQINPAANTKKDSSFWSKLSFAEWFMPSAIALGVMVIGAVMYSLTPSEKNMSVAEISENSRPLGQRTINPSAQLGRSNRSPASVKVQKPTQSPPSSYRHIQTHDNIPTSIQTHHVDRFPSSDDNEFGHYEEPYTDPYDNPFEEGVIIHEAPPAARLVPARERLDSRNPASVSEVMGYEENHMDEASDF